MKQHHTIETHDEIQSNKPRFGDVSGWARGRSLPDRKIDSKPIELAATPRLALPSRDSVAARVARKRKLMAMAERELAEQEEHGIAEARAMARASEAKAKGDAIRAKNGVKVAKTTPDDIGAISDKRHDAGTFFANLYAGKVVLKG